MLSLRSLAFKHNHITYEFQHRGQACSVSVASADTVLQSTRSLLGLWRVLLFLACHGGAWLVLSVAVNLQLLVPACLHNCNVIHHSSVATSKRWVQGGCSSC